MKISQKNNQKTKSTTKTTSSNRRLARGRARDEARFTAVPTILELPKTYFSALEEIKLHLSQSRVRASFVANSILIETYWRIGRVILLRQEEEGWGTKVIDRLAVDLRETFPDMRGLSSRNLLSMKNFAEEFPSGAISKQAVSKLPWGHVVRLLQMVKGMAEREFYAKQVLTCGWSRNVMEMQIESQLHLRIGKAQNNFVKTMPSADSDIATQIFKDPYLFDFLGTADVRNEREIEKNLIDHVQKFLLELGAGFAFVGRQVHLEVGNQDFYLDLLFYHLTLRRYVVVELKSKSFTPEDAGQLNFYLAAVDDLLRHADDKPTIGLLLCKEKNKLVAEYALRGLDQSIAVAKWQAKLTEKLPKEFKGSLPTIEEIEAELSKTTKSKI